MANALKMLIVMIHDFYIVSQPPVVELDIVVAVIHQCFGMEIQLRVHVNIKEQLINIVFHIMMNGVIIQVLLVKILLVLIIPILMEVNMVCKRPMKNFILHNTVYLGICQCSTFKFYNGTPSLGNGYCVPLRLYNETCSVTSNCDYRVNLTCVNNICTCASGKNYDSAATNGGTSASGYCLPAAGYHESCSSSFLCSASQNLYCDIGGTNLCQCNDSWSYWDGLQCTRKLSIGGKCTDNTACISADGLFCSNYTLSTGQCDCDKNHYWNNTCIIKELYNESCSSSYVCDDNRGLQCQGLGGSMFQKCDCYNTTYIWDSLYTIRSKTCIPKLTNGGTTCYGDLECEDFNYLKCNSGICGCSSIDYWDGSRCQTKKNYTIACNNTYECRDFSPVNLICTFVLTSPPGYRCDCNATSNWDQCLQQCVTSKKVRSENFDICIYLKKTFLIAS